MQTVWPAPCSDPPYLSPAVRIWVRSAAPARRRSPAGLAGDVGPGPPRQLPQTSGGAPFLSLFYAQIGQAVRTILNEQSGRDQGLTPGGYLQPSLWLNRPLVSVWWRFSFSFVPLRGRIIPHNFERTLGDRRNGFRTRVIVSVTGTLAWGVCPTASNKPPPPAQHAPEAGVSRGTTLLAPIFENRSHSTAL
jgi:hypothetical protein